MKKACKAVLISIQPKWVQLILSGKKTLEIRKTAPKLEAPFKCYIYETQGPVAEPWMDEDGHEVYKGRGLVVAECVIDSIKDFGFTPYSHGYYEGIDRLHERSCVSFDQMFEYIGGGFGYGWSLSDVKTYDTPKGLDEFCKPCPKAHDCYGCAFWFPGIMDYGHCEPPCCGFWEDDASAILRAPQSWCYVEELTA